MAGTPLNHQLQAQFDHWNLCVIVPVYNHGGTIIQVLQEISQYTRNIIVINDGSTDGTRALLETRAPESAVVIHLNKNRGKGIALKRGFRQASDSGYLRAITMDADGQHKAIDIPKFVEALAATPEALMIGARDMHQETVPGGSTFGHRFSNFWYRVITGRRLPDTQSGFRLYPISRFRNWTLVTGKYELEMEVLVRLSWTLIPVIPVPIDVYYPPGDERITHFRKVPDFVRITLLSTLFVVLGLLIARPIRFFRRLTGERAKALFREHVLGSKDSNEKLTQAVMLGLFVGVAPIWGFQIVVVIFLTVLLKLNKVIALAAAHISIPPMIPIILFASYRFGGLILGRERGSLASGFQGDFSFEQVQAEFGQYVVGSLVFGVTLALVVGAVFYVTLRVFRKTPVPVSVTGSPDAEYPEVMEELEQHI